MKQYDFPLLIVTLLTFWTIGVAILIFCAKRVSLLQSELKTKLAKEERLIKKAKLNIMIINTLASVAWVIFFTIRSIEEILEYVK